MRKILSLLLALCLLCGAGCAAEFQLKYLTPALYPVCAEGAELTVWARQLASVEDFDTNLETLALEELTGVHINWILANHSEIDSKFNLSIASGDYPDVYLANFSRADVLTYAGDGVIIPLNELLESTYWLKQYMEAINVVGLTFEYTPEGTPRGLCRAGKLYYVTTAGGKYVPEEFGYGYIKALAQNFYGIKDTELIMATGLDVMGADTDAIMQEAIRRIETSVPV